MSSYTVFYINCDDCGLRVHDYDKRALRRNLVAFGWQIPQGKPGTEGPDLCTRCLHKSTPAT